MVVAELNLLKSFAVRHPNVDVFDVEQVKAPEESDNPEPRRLLKDEPFKMRLVVEAVESDAYVVDE